MTAPRMMRGLDRTTAIPIWRDSTAQASCIQSRISQGKCLYSLLKKGLNIKTVAKCTRTVCDSELGLWGYPSTTE